MIDILVWLAKGIMIGYTGTCLATCPYDARSPFLFCQ